MGSRRTAFPALTPAEKDIEDGGKLGKTEGSEGEEEVKKREDGDKECSQ